MTILSLSIAACTITVGAFVQGLSGFGYSMVSIPIMSMLFLPQEAVVIGMAHSLLANINMWWATRQHVELGRIWPLCLGGLLTLPCGAWILKTLPTDHLRLLIGIATCGAAVLLLAGVRFRPRRERSALFPVGMASGLMAGSVSMAGPPVVLFLTGRGEPKDTFRANIVAYFLSLNIVSWPTFIANGLLSTNALTMAACFMPCVWTGNWLGNRSAARLSQSMFQRVTLALITSAGLAAVFSAI